MRRHHVPEQHLLEAEVVENPVDDRRRRLRRARARQLALRRERDAGDAGATVAGSLADEDDSRVDALLDEPAQPLPPHRPAVALPIEVERRAEGRAGEPVDEGIRPHG